MYVKNMVAAEQFRPYLTVFVSLEHYLKNHLIMKKFFMVLLSSFAIATLQAQVATAEPASILSGAVKADALALTESSYDFGKIPQGKPVTHIFEVINNGSDSLKITNVQASCGCTTPEWEREKIQAPGEKTAITVGYNAATEGQFLKTITVMYNDNQSKQITIKGEVWKTPLVSAPENKELKSLKEDLQ
jgi:hypothetical protein